MYWKEKTKTGCLKELNELIRMEELFSLPFFVMASCQTQRELLGISLQEQR